MFHIAGYAQGTSYNITYYADNELVTKRNIEFLFAVIDSSLSIYKPYSLVSRFNDATSGIQMDEHLERVIRKSLEVTKKTAGAFDITVQPLVQAWGFGNETITEVPDAAAIQFMLKCVGINKLWISGTYLGKQAPCVKIDVNGVAQGYSVDIMAEYLEKRGVMNYLVEIGGEIRLRGCKPGNRLMAVGIEGPGGDKSNPYPVQKVIEPPQGAITTSGHYRKYYMEGTKRISHLIDARTGYPIRNGTISVTVWARDAMTADAYDNALIAMGVEEGLAFAEQHKELEAYFIYETAEGTVADTATTGFYKMVRNSQR